MKTSRKKMSEVLRQKDYDKVRTIVHFMEEHGEITPKEAETITGKSAATVRRYFKILVIALHRLFRNCPKITCADNADCADLNKLNTQVINGQFLSAEPDISRACHIHHTEIA